MSHFAVAIITKGKPSEDDIENILAPYSENLEVERFIPKEELIQKEKTKIEDYKNSIYADYLKDKRAYKKNCRNEAHIKYLEDEFPKKLNLSDEEYYQMAIKYEEENVQPDGSLRTTYNPKSKWDWWQIGGRWAGYLRILENVKDFIKGSQSLLIDKSIDCYEKNEVFIRVDGAFVKDILNQQDQDLYKEKLRFWELKIEGQEPVNDEEKDILKWDFYKTEYYLKKYKTKENFADLESQLYTFAAITKDGIWHAAGTMGMWATTDATEDQEEAWQKGFKEFVFDNAEDDDFLTIVDCHI